MKKNVSTARRELLSTVNSVVEKGPFSSDWTSLRGVKVPRWYREGKFGIFVHWGVYSVPAFDQEWYPRNMYVQGTEVFEHHRNEHGDQGVFGYKDFIPQLTGERFDPREWARLFRRAGAQFVVPVAEHHDGFAMYESGLTRWKASAMGPGRDVIGELADAVRSESMTFGLSSHRAEHWWFFNGGTKFDSDVQDPELADFYGPAQREELQPTRAFLDDWLARTAELVERYRPELVWFDWWIEQPAFAPHLQAFAAYFYNRGHEWNREVAINYKYEAFPQGCAVFDIERGQVSGARADFWQTDTSVSMNSWGYVANNLYKPVLDLIADLVDVVSKNGALLLNVGPMPDGSIPEPERVMLEEIGAWLDVNGEAIYGTSPWTIAAEGPTVVEEGAFTESARRKYTAQDIRFTTARGNIYATLLAISPHESVWIRSLARGADGLDQEIESVQLIGNRNVVEWEQGPDGLHLRLPEEREGTLLSFRIALRPRTTDTHSPELNKLH